ncbi:hypothetical protein D3C75_1361290 [compost metagenome]
MGSSADVSRLMAIPEAAPVIANAPLASASSCPLKMILILLADAQVFTVMKNGIAALLPVSIKSFLL